MGDIEAIERGELSEPPRRGDLHDAWDGLAAALGWDFDRLWLAVAARAAALERGEAPGDPPTPPHRNYCTAPACSSGALGPPTTLQRETAGAPYPTPTRRVGATAAITRAVVLPAARHGGAMLRLYRCSFRSHPTSPPRSNASPEPVLIAAESPTAARRLVEPYATIRGCEVAAVTPAEHSGAATA
jgi:hypothetical protein